MENKMILIKEKLSYDAGYEPTPPTVIGGCISNDRKRF
jgi:hypothetical protein